MGVLDWLNGKPKSPSTAPQVPPAAETEQTLAEEAGLPPNWVPVEAGPIIPGQQHMPPIANKMDFTSGPMPPNFGLQPALVDTTYKDPTGPISLMPIGVSPVQNARSQTVATITAKQLIAEIPPAATVEATNDGLTHGQTNVTAGGSWESDPAYDIMRDEFNTAGVAVAGVGAISTSQIGELLWTLSGSASFGGLSGGVPPYLGTFSWANNVATANAAAGLQLPYATSSASLVNGGMALFDSPGWMLTWVFKMDSVFTGAGAGFNTAHKTMYVGLTGANYNQFITATPASSRPDVFVGVRFDSSLSDTFLTLEVVENNTFSTVARHNMQGTTLVTDVTPTAGVWHRLDIIYSQAGQIILTLDGSSTNTLSTTISPMSFTASAASVTGSLTNNLVTLSYTIGASTNPSAIWGPGSQLTVSGYTGTQLTLNGTYPVLINLNTGSAVQLFYNLTHANIVGSAQAPTLSGYPAVTPCAMIGNDATGPAASGEVALYVDSFALVWNPNLGSSAPGTPDATKARYW